MWKAVLTRAACTRVEDVLHHLPSQGTDRLWLNEETQDPKGARVTGGRVHQNKRSHPNVLPWNCVCRSTKEPRKGLPGATPVSVNPPACKACP